jgi:hypothetical protein
MQAEYRAEAAFEVDVGELQLCLHGCALVGCADAEGAFDHAAKCL